MFCLSVLYLATIASTIGFFALYSKRGQPITLDKLKIGRLYKLIGRARIVDDKKVVVLEYRGQTQIAVYLDYPLTDGVQFLTVAPFYNSDGSKKRSYLELRMAFINNSEERALVKL